MNNTKFSLVLRQCRENAGLTQKQVSDALGVERSTYAYYETGTTRPSGSMIIKLANIFNVNYSVFMEAVSDVEFDNSEEDESYTTLTDVSWRDRERMYALAKDEQNMILLYRTLTSEQKKRVLELIKKYRADNLDKEKKEKKS